MKTILFFGFYLGQALQLLIFCTNIGFAAIDSNKIKDRFPLSAKEIGIGVQKILPQDTALRLQLIPNLGKWDPKVEVYSDLEYNHLLTRYSGWNGGDGCYSLLLPDGRILWSFQDSFFGLVKPDRARVDNVFVHNAGLIQTDPRKYGMVQLNPVKEGQAQTWIKYDSLKEDSDWYWTGAGIVYDGRYYKTLGHIKRTGSGSWDFKNVSTDVAVFSYPDFYLIKIVRDKTLGEVSYGSGIYEAADGYVYLYGTNSEGWSTNLHVARVPEHDFLGPWEFYTKNGWAKQPDTYSIGRNISPQPNVFKDGDHFYLVSQQLLGQDIYIYEADSPLGPWKNKRTIYRIPDTYDGHSIITYNACLHTALSRNGELVISYNVNPVNFLDNFNAPGSADKYRPYFIRVFNWK